jgi:hypothetical protein
MFANVLIVGLGQEKEHVVFVFVAVEMPGKLRVFASLDLVAFMFPLVSRV